MPSLAPTATFTFSENCNPPSPTSSKTLTKTLSPCNASPRSRPTTKAATTPPKSPSILRANGSLPPIAATVPSPCSPSIQQLANSNAPASTPPTARNHATSPSTLPASSSWPKISTPIPFSSSASTPKLAASRKSPSPKEYPVLSAWSFTPPTSRNFSHYKCLRPASNCLTGPLPAFQLILNLFCKSI